MDVKATTTDWQELAQEDWERTPASVRQLVVQLGLKIEQLEQHLKELQDSKEQLSEKVNRNSENSHSPPASDAPNFEKKKPKKPTGKKRGGQPGHAGHSRPLYPVCGSIFIGQELWRDSQAADRYNAYNWVDVAQRQLCWAHLKREFTKISERSGVSRQLGRDLLAQQKKS